MTNYKMIIEYFGTNLTHPGHYRWVLSGESFSHEKSLDFRGLGFNPEKLTDGLMKGETAFFQTEKVTALAVSGSPADKRHGTKSVFWVNGCVSKPTLYSEIMRNPLARKIVEAMPFEINWRLEY